MMEVRIPYDILGSERQMAREAKAQYRRDRNDIYRLDATHRNYDTWTLIMEYYICEANCNPDYDW